jgi:hypothetical protein
MTGLLPGIHKKRDIGFNRRTFAMDFVTFLRTCFGRTLKTATKRPKSKKMSNLNQGLLSLTDRGHGESS